MTLNEKSKFLSYILRHKPESIGLELDKEGWAVVDDLLNKQTDISEAELEQIVAEDEKQRYSFSDGGIFIRANQGHSVQNVKLSFTKAVPPTLLFHGTTAKAYESIKKDGLLPGKRHHVHLSHDLQTAWNVASRRKKTETIVLGIDCKKMLADGIDFFISENGIWLVETVKPKYITTTFLKSP